MAQTAVETSGGRDDSFDARWEDLRTSARGWHTVQLAVLGFIGLCGVLNDAVSATPGWLEVLAGLLILAALVLACIATVLVARAAWPLHAGDPLTGGDDAIDRAVWRVRRGIAMTFVAVGLLALGATSSWWPSEGNDDAPRSVQITTRAGVLCGDLIAGGEGALALDVTGRRLVLDIADVVALRPVDGCAAG